MDNRQFDRFLIDYRSFFLGQEVEIRLKVDPVWTGQLYRADENGIWLTEAIDNGTRMTFIPWVAIESTTVPPLPEAENGKA